MGNLKPIYLTKEDISMLKKTHNLLTYVFLCCILHALLTKLIQDEN